MLVHTIFQCGGSGMFILEPIDKESYYTVFYPIKCRKALKNMGWGSGIRDPGPGPGSMGQKRHMPYATLSKWLLTGGHSLRYLTDERYSIFLSNLSLKYTVPCLYNKSCRSDLNPIQNRIHDLKWGSGSCNLMQIHAVPDGDPHPCFKRTFPDWYLNIWNAGIKEEVVGTMMPMRRVTSLAALSLSHVTATDRAVRPS
jgi:hypothetical protein